MRIITVSRARDVLVMSIITVSGVRNVLVMRIITVSGVRDALLLKPGKDFFPYVKLRSLYVISSTL